VNGRVALVTGGGAGIGQATAVHLARGGAAVVVNDVRPELAADTTARITDAGGKALAAAGDVTKPEAVDDVVALAAAELGPIDILSLIHI
jgi:NAD(P)-dependent dehydrogenase (short-subunit alcohol dehydrogenase family)